MTAPAACESLAQLLILKVAETRWTASLGRALERFRPAGVWLGASRLQDSRATAKLLAHIWHTLGGPVFLAVQEQGGPADPLRGVLPALPSARAVMRKGEQEVERMGELIATALKLLGFNLNFAPVLDIASDLQTDVTRFSADPERVARCGKAFLRGLTRHNLLACAGHFPGVSPSATPDPRPQTIGKAMRELWEEDLLPYRRLLPDLPLVRLSNAAYKAYDFDVPRPAPESERVIQGLLRVKLGYEGLVVADLTAQQVSGTPAEAGENAVHCLQAGCDLVIVPEHDNACQPILDAFIRSAESGRLPTDRIERGLKRVSAVQKRLQQPPGSMTAGALTQLAQRFAQFARNTAE